uniref:Uncharacterized protein n=1 Tax=Onchocerca volvulus TaxID=6282 RepID=A0A8R1TYY5_ONCVO
MPFPPACFSMPQFPVEPSRFPFMAVPSFVMPSAFPPLPVVPRCAGLTVEEVAALDGIEERANTEVLINYIRNIGLLLDAVAMQLQQLISIVQPVRKLPKVFVAFFDES